MTLNPLIHNLAYFVDGGGEVGFQKLVVEASNGYRTGVAYDEDEDKIYSTTPNVNASRPHIDSWRDTADGVEYDEEEAAEWRAEGKDELRDKLESLVEGETTTVDI